MCGLTVFYNIQDLEQKIDILFRYIENRGPDKNIYKKFDNFHCLFSRLAIQDLSSNGDQPIQSQSKRYFMLFNGEIYNQKDIKLKIDKIYPSKKWKSTSDTEILLESFDIFGVDKTLEILRGMFAIFLYDFSNREVLLINDIFGEKPLYYQINKNSFLVSSSLDSFKYQKKKLNVDALKELTTINYIKHPNTAWDKIFKIEPSAIITFKVGDSISKVSKYKYYNLNKKIPLIKSSMDNLTYNLEDCLFKSVEQQLISDVPVGSFLSGGTDSTIITAIASKIVRSNIDTFTIGFKDSKFDESIYAKKIADYLGTNHNEKFLNNDNFLEIIDEVFKAYNEPFSDSSQIPTILLSKFCSEKVKVALTGDGGDELFGGYNRYLFNPRIWNVLKILPHFLRKFLSNSLDSKNKYFIKFIKYILLNFNSRFKNVHYIDQKIIQLLNAINSRDLFEFSRKLSSHIDDRSRDTTLFLDNKILKFNNVTTSINEDLTGLMLNDITTYLPGDLLVKVDRASMNFGLETRSPFLNKELFEFSRSLPSKYKVHNGESKIILKNLLKKMVPNHLIDRPKQGFLLPINEILKNNEFKEEIDLLFNKEKIKNQNIFNHDFISQIWKKYKSGYFYDQYLIWDIIVIQKWLDKNLVFEK